jgi:hypothetical protein
LFDVLVVVEPAGGDALLEALLVDVAGGLAGEEAGVGADPAGSFLSAAAGGAFSPSEGGLSLLE